MAKKDKAAKAAAEDQQAGSAAATQTTDAAAGAPTGEDKTTVTSTTTGKPTDPAKPDWALSRRERKARRGPKRACRRRSGGAGW